MPGGKQSKGKCAYCGQEIAKNAVAKHLTACAQRQEIITKTEGKQSETKTLYHLRIQAAGSNQFWLDLEMCGSATLKDLDSYLRAIWLECCGHLSRFSAGGWQGKEISKSRRADEIFEPGVELTHIYDFGTSSFTLIKMIGERKGKPTTSHPIALMARNLMPEYECIECKQPAGWLCMERLTEEDIWGVLCDEHAKMHPHDNYGEPVRLVNSPRLGLCGYAGPAEPPY
ncbi:MAG: hypothetical protein COX40_05045 [Candidatus Omnitrophica bacterium CG23_combo_of_CG06-09_8_20_14_all_40_11]|nr:MAG: hypothetical protein COX40_05045 [Candidatus Omnitrophica bacterium CG23_combo_of_CG06-09_8_20_14_all_40_11]